jgi:hypothetical protein
LTVKIKKKLGYFEAYMNVKRMSNKQLLTFHKDLQSKPINEPFMPNVYTDIQVIHMKEIAHNRIVLRKLDWIKFNRTGDICYDETLR